MKILIAIVACHARKHHRESQRQTWLKDLTQADYRFFLGRGPEQVLDDEVLLDVPDDYQNLVLKSRFIFEWAHEREYDYVFKCDDDTFVIPDRLLSSDFRKHDYTGEARVLDGLGRFICSGGGYWLSEKSLKELVNSPEEWQYKPRHLALNGPELWPEDRWVAEVLQRREVRPHDDRRYTSKEFADNETVIAKWEYSPEEMLEEYRRKI